MSYPSTLTVEPLRPEDREAVLAIYAEGLATGVATFESGPPDWEEWDRSHLSGARLGARDGGAVVGWAALSPVTDRCAYRGVAEVSVYVAAARRGRGIGSLLLARLVEASEALGVWTLQAGIFPENEASVEMHRKAGFRVVGRRERLGRLGGRWRDVLFLERRSERVGTE